MKANELRIGNWVNNNEEDYQITAATILHLERGDSTAKPIPITEEWLLKFGFENWDINAWINKISLHKQDGVYWHHSYSGHEICLEYVHQLQNLYFALTGEELILKHE